jgi:hypothetical protein
MSLGFGGVLWRRLKPTPGCNAKEEEEEEFKFSTFRFIRITQCYLCFRLDSFSGCGCTDRVRIVLCCGDSVYRPMKCRRANRIFSCRTKSKLNIGSSIYHRSSQDHSYFQMYWLAMYQEAVSCSLAFDPLACLLTNTLPIRFSFTKSLKI